jgi:hypothetical protein
MFRIRLLCVLSCLLWAAACKAPPPSAPPLSMGPDKTFAPEAPDTALRPPAAFASGEQPTRLRITNQCSEPIWLQYAVGSGPSAPGDVLGPQQIQLQSGESHDYPIPAGRLEATRFWPKTGCDAAGLNCKIGMSSPPCPDTGCMPPIESKFEATFAATDCSDEGYRCMTYWNASQVDGYTLPISVFPKGPGVQPPGTPGLEQCVESRCDALDLLQCPSSEASGPRRLDLRVFAPGDRSTLVGCLSPCKAHNYPPPYGEGLPEDDDQGLVLCCPEGVSPEECRQGPIASTEYVQYINRVCPNVYAYSYDDRVGLHKCPAQTQYEVVFCGGPGSGPTATLLPKRVRPDYPTGFGP